VKVESYDVVQVGYGPVGQTMAALLGQQGHRVAVFERHRSLSGLPRAGHVDHEIMRIFQSIDVADRIESRAWPMTGYDILDAQGEILQALDWNHAGVSGWHSDYLFYQPDVEEALDARVRSHASVAVHMGTQVTAVMQRDDEVGLIVEDRDSGVPRSVTASFVIGADGANSVVREASGIDWEDLGFNADWLVIDVRPHDTAMQIDMPAAGQICDPARPVSLFRWLGREHCRWEFMLLPGEDPAQIATAESVWRLLAPWGLTPDNTDLVRHAVYTFRSRLAKEYVKGRTVLVGDAAHLMPPFMGQGMCSGIRDAKTLAWRLDLILRGRAGIGLLDGYASERRPHAEALIRASIGLGQVVCTLDPEVAAQRDAMFRADEAPPPEPFPGLVAGALHRDERGELKPPAGALTPQGVVRIGADAGRFDDIVGSGWRVIINDQHAISSLGDRHRTVLAALAAVVVQVGDVPGDGVAVDVDGTYRRWLGALDATAVVVRPDFYAFGAAATPHELATLIDDLGTQLEMTSSHDLAPSAT
jgi:2-polyprenyl-6-methoxyphenol hydroxylase-like FAD-dependent oxidoreductase